MRADHAADDVMRVDYGRHPVAHGFVDGIAQGAAAALDRDDFGSQRPHFENVETLTANIFFAHIDLTSETEEGGRELINELSHKYDGKDFRSFKVSRGVFSDPFAPHARVYRFQL